MLPENTPEYNQETRVVTLPVVKGIQWKVNDTPVSPGRLNTIPEGEIFVVEAEINERVRISGDSKWTFGV